MENRDKMICRNIKYKIFSMVVLVACMMFLSGCIFAPTKKEVENYVANQTDEDCRIINSSGNPFYKTYMFRSRERDLEFDVEADTKNGQKVLASGENSHPESHRYNHFGTGRNRHS